MDYAIFINWTSPFPILAHSAASDLGLHSLPRSSKRDTMLIWVNLEGFLHVLHWSLMHMSRVLTKPIKRHVRPAKTQISLGIHLVWSESSLSAWRKLGSLAAHRAHSKDWSDWANAQADLSLRWAHSHFVGFVMTHLIFFQLSSRVYTAML